MIKTAVPFLAEMAGKAAPILKNFASKAIHPASAKIIGSTIGAVGGGMLGAEKAPEGAKGRGFLLGAAAGGGIGYFGGKTVAGLTGAGPDAARLKGFASELSNLSTAKTNTDVLKGVNKHLATAWASPQHLKEIPTETLKNSPEHRPWFGIKTKGAVQKVNEGEGSAVTSGIGNMARNLDAMLHGGYGLKGTNVVTRTGQILGREANEAMHYTHDGYRYKRSVPGKILGATMASGLGFGALEGATATNPDGTPASVPKKVLSGTTTALKWGLATPAMAAKNIAYDIPKTLINPGS